MKQRMQILIEMAQLVSFIEVKEIQEGGPACSLWAARLRAVCRLARFRSSVRQTPEYGPVQNSPSRSPHLPCVDYLYGCGHRRRWIGWILSVQEVCHAAALSTEYPSMASCHSGERCGS